MNEKTKQGQLRNSIKHKKTKKNGHDAIYLTVLKNTKHNEYGSKIK